MAFSLKRESLKALKAVVSCVWVRVCVAEWSTNPSSSLLLSSITKRTQWRENVFPITMNVLLCYGSIMSRKLLYTGIKGSSWTDYRTILTKNLLTQRCFYTYDIEQPYTWNYITITFIIMSWTKYGFDNISIYAIMSHRNGKYHFGLKQHLLLPYTLVKLEGII